MYGLVYGLIGNIAYDLLKGILLSSVMVWILRKAFGLLKERKQAVYFFGGGTILVALVLLLSRATISNAPDFRGGIMVGHSGSFTGPGPEGARVLVFGNFVNSGQMQSILYDWKLTAEMNGNSYVGENVELNQITMHRDGKSVTYFPDDALYERALTPVPVGGMVEGILLFVFPKLGQDTFPPNTKFTLTFKDALDHQYTHVVNSTGGSGQFGYMPGLHQRVGSSIDSPVPNVP